jgi:hypothetical protein
MFSNARDTHTQYPFGILTARKVLTCNIDNKFKMNADRSLYIAEY